MACLYRRSRATLSLVGNLEDLGLGDILQIVSLSRKSGVLHLEQDTREGAIIFRDGQVVCAYSTTTRRKLSELLVEQGLLTEDQKKQCYEVWSDSGKRDTLSAHVERDVGVSHDKIQSVIRGTVEKAVYHLFRWREGTFNFELKDVEEELKALDRDDAQLVLDVGLNPQYLAMEGARLQDESTLEEQPEEDEGDEDEDIDLGPSVPEAENETPAPAAAAAPVAPVPSGAPVVLLIDDDGLTLSSLSRKLLERGFRVETAANAAEGMAAYEKLEAAGTPVYLVADLLMPRSDGAGILGGLEILEFVRKRGPAIRTILITDYDNEDARTKATAMKADGFLRKPRRAQLHPSEDTPELITFLDEIGPMLATWAAKDVSGASAPASEPLADPEAAAPSPSSTPAPESEPEADDAGDDAGEDTVNIRDELAKEFEEGFFTDGVQRAGNSSRGLGMLKAMTDELNDPNSSVEITLLVLRFAAELMSRSVIFVITPKEICGLGEFGVEVAGENPTVRVRKMRIPRNEESILHDVLERQAPVKGPLKETKWNRYIIDKLGGAEPSQAFAAPIASSGRVVAILYGDNAPSDEEIGDTESLEIFLVQAGMAMDRALLARQLRESSGKAG